MKFSLLTYNLLYNKATPNLAEVLTKNKPDVICLQEVVTNDENFKLIEKKGYKLADYSNFIERFGKVFGVATFYNPKVFTFNSSLSFNLPRAFFEVLLYLFQIRLDPRFVLKTEFVAKKSKKRLCVYNIHLTPFATNALRVKQINNFLPDLQITKDMPVVVAGDFNYPYRRKGLEGAFGKYGLKEATHTIYTTYQRRIFRFFLLTYKTDYILYKHIKHIATKKIMVYFSDHFPLIAEFEL